MFARTEGLDPIRIVSGAHGLRTAVHDAEIERDGR
jgi:hypothetical protein